MSGELTPGMFRWTTTQNNDFVLGDPGIGGNLDKFIVFQANTTPGYSSNPHIRVYYDSGSSSWKFSWSEDGSTSTAFAILGSPNTFTAANTFTNDVTISGITTLGTSVSIQDKLITLNSAGAGSSGSLVGIEVNEASTITGYAKTSSDRNSWQFKAPNNTGFIGLTPSSSNTSLVGTASSPISLNLPSAAGSIARIEDINTAIGAVSTNKAIVSNGSGQLVASSVTATELGYMSGVTSAVQTQFAAKASLSGATFTGAVAFTTFTGDHASGKLLGKTLPSAPSGAQDQKGLIYDDGSGAMIWGGPFVTTTGVETITGNKTFTFDGNQYSNRTAAPYSSAGSNYVHSVAYTIGATVPSQLSFNGSIYGVVTSTFTEAVTGSITANNSFTSTLKMYRLGTTAADSATLEVGKGAVTGTFTAPTGSQLALYDIATGLRYFIYIENGVLTTVQG